MVLKRHFVLPTLILAFLGMYVWIDKASVRSRVISTKYGDFTVTEPVLLDLFDSPALERIKGVRQYGLIDYIADGKQDYTRYEHCVGVWALLRKYGRPLDEQIAGLIHDVSHTVFSHVGEYVFKHHSDKNSYQDDIHDWYLKKQGLDKVLAKYNFSLTDVSPKNEKHKAQEQDLPDLCADRIDYNIKAGLMCGNFDESFIPVILDNLKFENGRWFFLDADVAKKLAEVSLYNTLNTWGGPVNHVTYTWGSDALHRAMEIELLTLDDIHFSTDDVVWDKLNQSSDPVIKQNINKIMHYKDFFKVVSTNQADDVARTKHRGLDPWVKTADGFKRLTELDQGYKHEFDQTKLQASRGWGIQFIRQV